MWESLSWIATVLSIAGGFLVTATTKKIRIIAFIIWIISDFWWCSFNFYYHHWASLALFTVYLGQCFLGIYNNSKKQSH